MLRIKRITRDKQGHEKVDLFLKSKGFHTLFFHSPFTIQTWLNTEAKELYLATYEEEKILLVYDNTRAKDVRFFFDYPSKEFLEEVIKHFDAKYIGVNELIFIPQYVLTPGEGKEELIADLETLEKMEDPRIRKEYNRCIKKHPSLRFKEMEATDIDAIKMFLEEWQHTRTEKQNSFARITADLSIIDAYLDYNEVHGGVVYDGERVIGMAILIDSYEQGTAISVSNKILRGYTELGTYLYVEKAKLMRKKGFTRANLEKINNDFKNKFRLNSTSVIAYSHEAWIKGGWTFTPNFLQRFI